MQSPNPCYKALLASPLYVRIPVGLVFLAGGVVGFLPIVGFWMIPVGLYVWFARNRAVRTRTSRWRRHLMQKTKDVIERVNVDEGGRG